MTETIIIMGPTAVGKTTLAIEIAQKYGLDIVSADSRQVYKGLNIGTGKDLLAYENAHVKHHLIDIVEPEIEYTLAHYQKDFSAIQHQFQEKNKSFIWCGGTGLYFLAILNQYQDTEIPENHELRKELENLAPEKLNELYQSLPHQAHDDIKSKRRLIRAIEKGYYLKKNQFEPSSSHKLTYEAFCITEARDEIIKNIDERLDFRFKNGMVEEVEQLLKNGLKTERLIRLGLEYKFITRYLVGEINKPQMIESLKIAIHQFSKRQMTFFRKMEKDGIAIKWLNKQDMKRRFGL
ncbi:MAG: tRNA (adenosine(37)-N6)-dimethylallyltransferase MiaA [Cytophagales bacterium]